jgi:UDP-glucose 4-epimerase
MILAMSQPSSAGARIYNLGTDEYCAVDESLSWITGHLGLNPKRNYTGGSRGWIGDSPFIFLDTAKIKSLGWRPKLSIREAVIKTLAYLQQNSWLLEGGK